MKRYLGFVLVIIGFCAAAQQPAVFEEPQNGPRINFSEDSFDFGDIVQGQVVEHIFEFENSGNEPLILSNVLTTCGCTAPSWPREPIPPGETASILVKFNSQGKIGMQNKVITIISNAINQRERIKIVTNVMMKAPEGG